MDDGVPAPTLHEAARADVPLVCQLMSPRDVWENLGYCRAPTPLFMALNMRRGMHALVIRVEEQPVGLYLVYGPYGSRMELEFDGAISVHALRRRGLAMAAMEAFLLFMFNGRCRRLNAVIHEENLPSRALLRKVGFREEPGETSRPRHGGAPRKTVLAWMDRRAFNAGVGGPR